MKSLKLRKIVASAVAALTIATLSPIGASAKWKQDSKGWWNTEGSSWSTGWRSIDNTWYYFGSDGYMKTGWANDGGTWYYMQPSGAMKTGWVNDGGTWYYLQASGAMKTGWINDRGTWYFANASGAMQTGVIQVNGKIYYFAPSGAMQTGTVVINGVAYTFAASGEAIGNKIPTATKAFTISADGTVVEVSVTKAPVKPVINSNGGGGGKSHHSSGNGDSGSDDKDITSIISSAYSAKIASTLANNPVLSNNVSVKMGDPIEVTLLDSKLDSLKTVFETAQGQDLSTIEARLTKAEELMNLNSTMLNVNGVTFKDYLAQAETSYLANGGNSNYINKDGSFKITEIAKKIENNTLTYAEFKTNLEDRIIAMCNETKNAPQISISDGNISQTVTKIQRDGQPIYDTNLSIDANIEGLVSLGDAAKGTYTIYCGANYFTVEIS